MGRRGEKEDRSFPLLASVTNENKRPMGVWRLGRVRASLSIDQSERARRRFGRKHRKIQYNTVPISFGARLSPFRLSYQQAACGPRHEFPAATMTANTICPGARAARTHWRSVSLRPRQKHDTPSGLRFLRPTSRGGRSTCRSFCHSNPRYVRP